MLPDLGARRLVVVLGLLTWMLAGCAESGPAEAPIGTATESPRSESQTENPPGQWASDLEDRANAAADRETSDVVITGGSGTFSAPETRKDASQTVLASGDYTLKIYCAGSGVINGTITAEETSASVTAVCSREQVGAANGRLHLDADVSSFSITLTPDDGAEGALAYRFTSP